MEKSTLSALTLFLGWLGSHKFYINYPTNGAIYFYVTLIGLVLTLYTPIHLSFTAFGREFQPNIGVFVLLLPFVVSFIEFLLLQRKSETEIAYRYQRTQENMTVVFVAQFLMLFLLFIPKLIARGG
jgi:hypothetical protein